MVDGGDGAASGLARVSRGAPGTVAAAARWGEGGGVLVSLAIVYADVYAGAPVPRGKQGEQGKGS
ncbi:hypothetical protein, partial [Streptosporangium sp. NPDC002524]|uniref:hypothetical protein n=1 Tax=Streptosporangium sp. NPDC002524 TaxID=3154537 RepID=UPI0033312104